MRQEWMTKFNWMDTGTVTGGIPRLGQNREDGKNDLFGPAKKGEVVLDSKINFYWNIQ